MANLQNFPPQTSMVRRTDVLLRAMYPQIDTRIFELHSHQYQIVFEKDRLNAEDVNENFTRTVCPAQLWMVLSNELPEKFLREIDSIPDGEISIGLEGFSFTIADIETILLCRYPDLPKIVHSPNSNNPITLLFEHQLDAAQEEKVRSFMAGCLPDWPLAIGVADFEVCRSAQSEKRKDAVELGIRPSRLRPEAPSFVREDEAFWFENIDRIFSNRLHPNTFTQNMEAGTACYLDGSTFPQIDFRQAVLLYDTVYLTPPIIEASSKLSNFWEEQSVTQEDVLRLIEVGRVRLILVQPEERTDPNFLRAAHERNPSGIIGRLTAAAMMASDIIATADEYTFSAPELRPVVSVLSSRISQEIGVPETCIARLLLWPLHAQRTCLSPLMSRGLMGISSFSQGNIFAEEILSATGRDVRLEALATSDAVHIAHILNATLIPPTQEMQGWVEPRRVIGDRLNFYRSFNTRIAAAWAVNERRKEQRRPIIPPVPLFKFNPRAKIDEIIAVTSLGSTRRKGRAIMTRISELTFEEQSSEIEKISQELYSIGARRSRNSFAIDTFSDAIDIAAAAIDYSLAPVRPMWNFLNGALNIARRAPALDKFVDSIESDIRDQFGRNSDLDFLSKVSRVAEIQNIRAR